VLVGFGVRGFGGSGGSGFLDVGHSGLWGDQNFRAFSLALEPPIVANVRIIGDLQGPGKTPERQNAQTSQGPNLPDPRTSNFSGDSSDPSMHLVKGIWEFGLNFDTLCAYDSPIVSWRMK